MKILYISITLLFIILTLAGCESHAVKDSRAIKIKNVELKKIIEDYYRENLSNEKGVVMVDMYNEFTYVKEKHDTSIFYVYSVKSLSSILNHLPFFYSVTDQGPVLFYTGIEHVFSFDNSYRKELKDALNPYLYDDLTSEINEEGDSLIHLPPNYNPMVWKVEIVSDSVVLTKLFN